MKRHGRPEELVTDKLRSYGRGPEGAWIQDSRSPTVGEQPRENSHQPFRRESGPCCASGACTPPEVRLSPLLSHNHFNSERSLTSRDTYKQPAPPLSPSGGRSAPPDDPGRLPETETSSHSSDSTSEPFPRQARAIPSRGVLRRQSRCGNLRSAGTTSAM
jgi:putative transposase